MASTPDERAARRGYAKLLKGIDQALELERFACLRQAYEAALVQAQAIAHGVVKQFYGVCDNHHFE